MPKQKKYLINSLDKVQDGDFVDWMNYAGSAIGQGIGNIPTSIATKGASSLLQQMGSIYMDSLQKIANGISLCSITTGIKENSASGSLGIFPNPASHSISVLNFSQYKTGKVIIRNSIGQIVLSEEKENINLSQLSNGIYFVEISLIGNPEKQTIKLIKDF